jgi:hypothetical protein
MDEDRTTWFDATSGRATGWMGLVAGAVVVVVGIVDRSAAGIVAGLLIGLLSWVVLLRPRVGIGGGDLLLRGMVSTTAVPLATVETVTMRQVLAVRAGEHRYVSAAVGHSLRDLNRQRRLAARSEVPEPTIQTRRPSYADHVSDLITERAREARRDGAAGGPARRQWAWPELAAVAVLVVALVVALLV